MAGGSGLGSGVVGGDTVAGGASGAVVVGEAVIAGGGVRSTVTLATVASGGLPIGYQWQFNGTNITTNNSPAIAGSENAARLGGIYRS